MGSEAEGTDPILALLTCMQEKACVTSGSRASSSLLNVGTSVWELNQVCPILLKCSVGIFCANSLMVEAFVHREGDLSERQSCSWGPQLLSLLSPGVPMMSHEHDAAARLPLENYDTVQKRGQVLCVRKRKKGRKDKTMWSGAHCLSQGCKLLSRFVGFGLRVFPQEVDSDLAPWAHFPSTEFLSKQISFNPSCPMPSSTGKRDVSSPKIEWKFESSQTLTSEISHLLCEFCNYGQLDLWRTEIAINLAATVNRIQQNAYWVWSNLETPQFLNKQKAQENHQFQLMVLGN